VGLDLTRVRSEGSKIRGTNGISDGIVPMLKHVNTAAQYVNQSGRRKGAFAMYLEPWHADVFAFLDLRMNTGGDETNRARDLFYALFVNDAFMDAVKKNASWYLFNPDRVKKLANTFGKEFTTLYYQYVKEKMYEREIPAVTLFKKILDVQLSVGTPYLVFKDAVNVKSNLKHYAPVRSSNLCVAGSTRVLTEFGYMRIDEMVDDDVKVWNGQEWSETTIRKTGENQPLKRLQFNNGLHLDCTPSHKFYIQQSDKKEAKMMEACELRRGMILEKFDIPKWEWSENDVGELTDNRNTVREVSQPPWQGNKKQVMDWLQRRFSHGMKVENKTRTRDENMNAFLLSQLINGQKDVQALVYKVEEEITYGDTFCFTEHKRGRGVFNGLCTGQCAEITLPTLPDEIGTCNLASLNLRQHLIKRGTDLQVGADQEFDFDFEGIKKTTKQCVRSLNHVVDNMNYSKKESENCNRRHRPLGIGVQGLADVFYSLRIPFESLEARKLNYRIFEHINFAALEESCTLAEEKEENPKSYLGSPLQKEGKLQKDLWDDCGHRVTMEMLGGLPLEDPHLDWKGLREKIAKHGVYNMMLLALMPTASTAQTMSNYESFEPALSNLFTRHTMMGEFVVTSPYLVKDLQKLGLWDEELKNEIAMNSGSLQNIKKVPVWMKELYKTVWEIDQKILINLAADRGRFIDHSMSMNLYFTGKDAKQKMMEAYFLAWERGLKTGVYYLRTKSAIEPFNLLAASTTSKVVDWDNLAKKTICHLDSGDCCSA
jgi:ribonucleotide reductase alpha subunit